LASDGFSVEGGKLLYKDEPVGESASRPGFQQFAFEDTALGEGGNGVTFRVQHRTLKVDQVVKVYSPKNEAVAEKALREAQKNADPKVRDIIAQVHDAGTYPYPENISYSVMESVSGIQTLKEWLDRRDEDWESAQTSVDADYGTDKEGAQQAKKQRRQFVMAEALNVAAGFVGAGARMHAADVIHGDLNPGNILILQEASSEPLRTAIPK
jgi:serine/threonine protein kinase